MKNNILAIVASTKRTGLATSIDGQIKYSVIESNATDVEKRIGIMRDGIIDFIKENNIKEIVLEEVRTDGMNSHTGKILTWLQGCIVVAAYEYDKTIKFNYIGPSSWRSALGLQGYRTKREQQKQIDINFVNKTYGLNLTPAQDDEADAICILTAFCKDTEALNSKSTKKSINDYESAF